MSSPSPTASHSLPRILLRFFFRHFYHGFAWTYDSVAALVSLGRWNHWVRSALPYVEGSQILEIGHGPGHLQQSLRENQARTVIGLDESPQMGRIARRRLQKAGHERVNLARGLGQALPFPSSLFDTVVSTFPAEYIFDEQTFHEVKRVLRAGGCFVIVPAAWIVGRKALDRAAAWLFRATDQVPQLPAEVFGEKLRKQLEEAGFNTDVENVQLRSSQVLIVIARA